MLERYDIPESNAKCHSCSMGLMYVEHKLYGNRCHFCTEQLKYISAVKFIKLAYYDWKIFNETRKLPQGDTGRVAYIGCLGVIGVIDINQIDTVEKKKRFLKELRYVRKQLGVRKDEFSRD